MKLTLILICFVAFIALATSNPQNQNRQRGRQRTPEERQAFRAWRQKHGKQFDNPEREAEVMEKMLKNKEAIDAHNKLYEEGKVSFRRGLFKYSDMTLEEKKQHLTGLKLPAEVRSAPIPPSLPQFPPAKETEVDWGKKGLVGPVQDQGYE
jgi:Ni/Co efflux regulator RcnB